MDKKLSYISALHIDYYILENSVRATERAIFINKVAVTVEDHTQLKNSLRNIEIIRVIRNSVHNSIYATLIVIVLNVMVGNQICALDVDQSITSSNFF